MEAAVILTLVAVAREAEREAQTKWQVLLAEITAAAAEVQPAKELMFRAATVPLV